MNIKILFVVLLTLAFAACEKKENLDIDPPANLGGESWTPTAVDVWLKDSLTTPYNISVKYKWDPFELRVDKTLTPPDEDKIVPAMSAIKRVWIDPYNEETGSDLFMKKYSPKQFKLVGSVEYNYNGTVILGQAEGGNNIIFFDINQNFDQDPVSSVKRMIQTSHHEFAHVLHQTVLYPQEFKGISARLGMTGYTATWFNVSLEEANANGYVTSYSMASYDEDFVEMVANMLMEGRVGFNEIVAAQNETAQSALRQKEQIVVNYFRDVWNIDFYSLQTRVQAALERMTPPPTVNEVFAYNGDFNGATVNPDDAVSALQPATFHARFNAAASNVAALAGNQTLDSFQIVAGDATTMYLLFYLTQANAVKVGAFGYDDVVASNGNHTYAYFGSDAVGAEIGAAVNNILTYFNNRQFKLSWYSNPFVTRSPWVKFSPVNASSDYTIGKLTFVP